MQYFEAKPVELVQRMVKGGLLEGELNKRQLYASHQAFPIIKCWNLANIINLQHYNSSPLLVRDCVGATRMCSGRLQARW